MGRIERINSAIRGHDYKLFCKLVEGKLHIYRKSNGVETFRLEGGEILHSIRSVPHFVMALTHNWNATGYPVDWGIEPIMARLKSIDLWSRDIVGDIEKQSEKSDKEMERKMKTDAEAFAYEFRDSFKNTFKDVNTASLDKKKLTYNQRKAL